MVWSTAHHLPTLKVVCECVSFKVCWWWWLTFCNCVPPNVNFRQIMIIKQIQTENIFIMFLTEILFDWITPPSWYKESYIHIWCTSPTLWWGVVPLDERTKSSAEHSLYTCRYWIIDPFLLACFLSASQEFHVLCRLDKHCNITV